MNRKDRIVYQILVPLGISMLASVVLTFIPIVIIVASEVPWWTTLALFGGVFVFISIATRQKIAIRNLMVRVYKEVSASKCNNYFITLAENYFKIFTAQNALSELRKVVEVRKHPNAGLLQMLERISQELESTSQEQDNSLSVINSDKILKFLSLLPHKKASLREGVVQNVAKYILDNVTSNAYLVLYGYSTTVCDSLVAVSEHLPCPVFLSEDVQYGVKRSLGEHKMALKHLERGGITPNIIEFKKVPGMTSSSLDFVETVSGKLVPLAKGREVIAIIGCEAADINGNVLIASRSKGIPSETAKFVEVFRPELSETEVVQRKILVINESYKIYDLSTPNILVTRAPLKLSLLGHIAYLFGLKRDLHLIQTNLIKLNSSDISAIIDDYGIHFGKGSRIDLEPSFLEWQKQSFKEIFPMLVGNNIKKLLRESCTIICDLDGVIVDTEPLHFSAFGDVVRSFKKNLTYRAYLEECGGLSDEEGAKNLIRHMKLPASENCIVEAKKQSYNGKVVNVEAEQLFLPGAIELLKTLERDGKKLYLVTSSAPDNAEYFLANTELAKIFPSENRYFGANAVSRKQIYMEIINKSQSEATKFLLLDDSPRNLALGRNLGIKTIGFATTWTSEELNADGVISGADDLLKRYILQ
jgi:beta-phosphoglucomutase